MRILNKLIEISLSNMNKKFDDDIKKDNTRVPFEIRIGRIFKKAEKDINKEKDYVEIEDVGLLKKGFNLILGKKKENNKLVYSFMTKTKSNGNQHIQRLTFYLTPLLEDIKKLDRITKEALIVNNDSSVYCDCKSFKYHFSKMNKKRDSYYLGAKNKNKNDYKVKGLKPSPNPRNSAGLCKHLKFDVEYINNNINTITRDIYKYLKKDNMLDKLIGKTINKSVDKAIDTMDDNINTKNKRDVDKKDDRTKTVNKAMKQIDKEAPMLGDDVE